MLYLTQAQLSERLKDDLYIYADDGEGGLDAVLIENALQDASDKIDSYLAQAYSLPLPTVPRILERVCQDLTIYFLATGPAQSDEITERYRGHEKWLTLVAANKVSLGLPVDQEPESSEASFDSPGRSDFKSWSP
jgi:phage gp36-like protein